MLDGSIVLVTAVVIQSASLVGLQTMLSLQFLDWRGKERTLFFLLGIVKRGPIRQNSSKQMDALGGES